MARPRHPAARDWAHMRFDLPSPPFPRVHKTRSFRSSEARISIRIEPLGAWRRQKCGECGGSSKKL
eukprot:3751458-Pyramimonas_sp.AAC.1